jgi:hypothetical protein
MDTEVPQALAAIHTWAEGIELSPIGVAIAESRYAFMLFEGAHLIGLAFAVGLLFVIDLRLLGVLLRGVPVQRVLASLRPWVLGGFVVIFVTGGLLFWSAAGRLVLSPVFALKLLLIALAGANALYFETALKRNTAAQQQTAALPASLRAAALASLLLWSLVIISGRLIPYLPGWT